MSNGDVRKVSLQDIQLVQNLIERCLQLYMSQREVVSTLSNQANIEPGFTELVWQKLETENREFFRAYHLRLIVKDQIMRFNQLLERQVQLMDMYPTGIVSVPFSNGSQIHSMHNNSAYQSQHPIKPENMHQSISATLQSAVNMAGPVDMSANMLLAQSSNAQMLQEMNGATVKTETSYASGSPVMFGGDHGFLEQQARNAIGETSISRFNGESSSSNALHEAMMDPEMNSNGFLGQIPRNFSLSDLTADFSNSTDILESYSRSPFMGTDANFLDQQQDIRKLDTISEGFSYEDFGSD